jgi:predicted Zn-dependent protease
MVSPFAVPLDDHARVMGSWRRAVDPFFGMQFEGHLGWEGATRVVATSEGTQITQHVTRLAPVALVSFNMRALSRVVLQVPALVARATGFEAVMEPGIADQIQETAEAALRFARLPSRAFDTTGRLPVIFDGEAMATLLGTTLGQALDGDRMAGLEADAAGGSPFAAGGAPLSPLITVSADRSPPAYTAVRWDDEGVPASPAMLIERGVVRTFLTTRETAHRLARDGQLAGMAVAPQPTQAVMSGGAQLTLSPSPAPASLDALMKGVTHGILCYGGECLPEPGLSTGLWRGRMLLEVREGQPVSHVGNITFQFQTQSWWSNRLRALGDAGTARTALVRTQKGMPWQEVTQSTTAPAALIADVDIVRIDITP